jgi:hypothetical protein
MAMSELPIDAVEKNYQVTTVLEGDTFTFVVRWNAGRPPELPGAWFFDLYDVDGVIILAGVRIVLGTIFGRRSVDPRMPNGAIIASDTSGNDEEAGRDDLGSRVRLYYIPAADLEA